MPRASYSWMIYLRIYLSQSRLPVFVLPNFNKHIFQQEYETGGISIFESVSRPYCHPST